MEVSKGKLYIRRPDGSEELVGGATITPSEAAEEWLSLVAEEDVKRHVELSQIDLAQHRASPSENKVIIVSNPTSVGKSDSTSARYLVLAVGGRLSTAAYVALLARLREAGLEEAAFNDVEASLNRQLEAYALGALQQHEFADLVARTTQVMDLKRQQPFWTKDWRKGRRHGSR